MSGHADCGEDGEGGLGEAFEFEFDSHVIYTDQGKLSPQFCMVVGRLVLGFLVRYVSAQHPSPST